MTTALLALLALGVGWEAHRGWEWYLAHRARERFLAAVRDEQTGRTVRERVLQFYGRADGGFTLIELLIVLVVIGILLAIAVPSYLGIKDRANVKAAQSGVRNALVSVEEYNADNGGYTGMTPAALKLYDAGIDGSLIVKSAAATTYCIQATSGGKNAFVSGPGGTIAAGACP